MPAVQKDGDVMVPVEEDQRLLVNNNKERIDKFTETQREKEREIIRGEISSLLLYATLVGFHSSLFFFAAVGGNSQEFTIQNLRELAKNEELNPQPSRS